MSEIILESNFNGDIIFETSGYNGDYDEFLKGIRKAFKERGLLGGIGQITGLSTNKGAQRRKEKRETKAARKADKNERKNLLADAKANLKNAKAEERVTTADSGRIQAEALAAIPLTAAKPPEVTPQPEAPEKDNTMLYAGVAVGILVLLSLFVFLFVKLKKA